MTKKQKTEKTELHLQMRPRNFDEVIGNKSMISVIKSKLQKDKDGNHNFPHAVMLHGPKGSGKTTIGRIISKELGCDPDIHKWDFHELDSVKDGGIETARKIDKGIHYPPNEAKCKVYLLDEIQDSSKKFMAGLLKTFEDGPDHTYFILCTTDPQKVLGTLKSRCAKYKVRGLKEKELKQLIDWTLGELGESVSGDVIDAIAENAEGCPRECLVLLDSIIDLPPEKRLNSIVPVESDAEVRELCQALLKGANWKALSSILKGLKGKDAEQMRYAVSGYMSSVALNNYNQKSVDRAALIFDCFKDSVMYTKFPGFVFATLHPLK